jgi:hypothetical protein
MDAGRLVFYLGASFFLTWLLMTSGPTRRLWALHPFLRELGSCDFCLGVWVYTFFAWHFGLNILSPIYIPLVAELVTGAVAAFLAHLVHVGWMFKYGTMVVEGE